MKEKFKPYQGCLVGNQGTIIGRRGNPIGSNHRYRMVKAGSRKTTAHRLVAELWIPNPENKSEVNHINGNKLDNRVENLEWCTREENIQKSWEDGLRENVRIHNRSRTRENNPFWKGGSKYKTKPRNEWKSLLGVETPEGKFESRVECAKFYGITPQGVGQRIRSTSSGWAEWKNTKVD